MYLSSCLAVLYKGIHNTDYAFIYYLQNLQYLVSVVNALDTL